MKNALRLPGILLGIGLGGFVDGILLHQILQLACGTAPVREGTTGRPLQRRTWSTFVAALIGFRCGFRWWR